VTSLYRLMDTVIQPKPDFRQLRKVLLREGLPEYVPFYELFANPEIIEELLDKKIESQATTVEFYYLAGYDYVPVWPGLNLPLGSLIDTSSEYPITDWKSFDNYPWPAPESVTFDGFDDVTEVLPEGMQMIGQTGGILEAAEGLLGYQGLCYMLVDDPGLVQAIFDRLGTIYEAMYRGMAEIEGVGALVISDDMGFKTQTLIGAKDLRRYVLPWHKRLVEITHAAGKPCILHSCGQLAEIMDDIIEDVGIDAKHSFEDGILPITEAKRLYGNRVALLGGFDVDRLCRSSEEEVRIMTRKLVAEVGKDGGYALGSGNSIAAFVPIPNYLAMLDEGWQLRA